VTTQPGVIVEESPTGTFHFGTAPVGMPIRKVFDMHAPLLRQRFQEDFADLMLLLTQEFFEVSRVLRLTNRDGMEHVPGHLLKRGNHLALSNCQHLNRFAPMLPYPGAIDFLNPMGDGIFVGGIGGPEQLIGEGIKIDRRTIGADEHDGITLPKGIGPTSAPIILDGSLPQDGGDVLGKRLSIEGLVRHHIGISKALVFQRGQNEIRQFLDQGFPMVSCFGL
jgi:hypothetical protein